MCSASMTPFMVVVAVGVGVVGVGGELDGDGDATTDAIAKVGPHSLQLLALTVQP